MNHANRHRGFVRESATILCLFLGIIGLTRLNGSNQEAHGFITIAHYNPRRFSRDAGILIKRVHDKSWDIHYHFDTDCPDSRKNEKNLAVLRDVLSKSIREWLKPLAEVTDKPVVDEFIFHLVEPQRRNRGRRTRWAIHATFYCKGGSSTANPNTRKIFIREVPGTSQTIAAHLPYSTLAIMHEIGHAFALADTYLNNTTFDVPSSGNVSSTIGSQPLSVMSASSFTGDSDLPHNFVLSKDDTRGIQWLYRYHHENLSPTNCPPEFVYEKLTDRYPYSVGGCVPRQPLLFEARQGTLRNLQRILADNPNLEINERDEHGNTSLYYVAPFGAQEYIEQVHRTVKAFLAYPEIDINLQNRRGQTPLHLAAMCNNLKMVTLLLQIANIKVNAQDKHGATALHYAVRYGHSVLVDWMLWREKDIAVNLKEHTAGNTPLHIAAQHGYLEIVRLLLLHKDTEPNLRNASGLTALEIVEHARDAPQSDSSEPPEELLLFFQSVSAHRHISASVTNTVVDREGVITLLRKHPGVILQEASDVKETEW